jgi:hypothetical protein
MTTDLDADLRRLTAIDHPGLLGLEESVMARIHERRRSDATFGAPFIAVAALGAIALGTTAGSVSRAPAAAAPLSPFGPSTPLAPSTLLAADR